MSGTKLLVSHLDLSLSITVSVSVHCLLLHVCLFDLFVACLLLRGQSALHKDVARLLLYCVERKNCSLRWAAVLSGQSVSSFLQRGLGTDGNECRIRLCELLSNAVVRVKLKAKNIVN